jgi:hypothetical protein
MIRCGAIGVCVAGFGMWAFATAGLCGTFVDDFSNAAVTESTWEVLYRDWVVADGAYSAPGEAGLTQCPISLLPIEVEDGMVIEAQCSDLGDGNWSNFAVVFAYVDEDEAWAAGAGVGNNQWRIFQFTPLASAGGAWGVDIVPGVAVKNPFVAGDWYNVRVEIDGKTVTLFANSDAESDDLEEVNVYDMDSAPEGRVGLGAAGASPTFNEIRVTGRNVQPVEAPGKLATTWARVRGEPARL